SSARGRVTANRICGWRAGAARAQARRKVGCASMRPYPRNRADREEIAMVTGLPTADSLMASIATLRRKLATEEVGFRNTIFSSTSTDTTVTATANGMVEALTVSIVATAFPPSSLTV